MRNVLYVIIALAAVLLASQSAAMAGSADGFNAPELEKSSLPIKEYIIAGGTLVGIALVAMKNPRRTHVSSD